MKLKNIVKIIFLIFSLIVLYFFWHYREIIINKIKMIEIVKKKHSCPCNNKTMKLQSEDYQTKHVPAVKKHKFILDDIQLKNEINKGNLIPVVNGTGYKIWKLEYSSSYLHPKAYKILQEIGNRYQKRVFNKTNQESYIEISSLTRTSEQQKELVDKNPAATKKISTHCFGFAFDINLLKSSNCSLSLLILQELLNAMRDEGKIFLCSENHCIHVTVR